MRIIFTKCITIIFGEKYFTFLNSFSNIIAFQPDCKLLRTPCELYDMKIAG